MEETSPPLLLLSRRRGDRLAIRRSDKLNQLTHLPRRVLPPRLMIFKSSQSRRFTILSSTWLQLQRERERDDDSFTIFFTIFRDPNGVSSTIFDRRIFVYWRRVGVSPSPDVQFGARARYSLWPANQLFLSAERGATLCFQLSFLPLEFSNIRNIRN